jgi:starch synthase
VQLYSLRYGAVPIVHAVGGLRDTVRDPGDAELARGRGTGIRFEQPTAVSLAGGLERATRLYRDPDALVALRRGAMARDSSWAASAGQYVQLYRSLRA